MKLRKILFASVLFTGVSFAQNVGINGTGAAPANSAMLDVVASNKGVLIPRVDLVTADVVGPIAAPATSLLVYNLATNGTFPNDVYPGYYYWNGSRWERFDDNNTSLWVTTPVNINTNTRITLTIPIAGVTSSDAVNVNLYGDWATAPALVIESVEAMTNQVRIIVLNRNGVFGTSYTGVDFIISVLKP